MKLWISILLVCFAEIALADERDRRERERQERIESIRSELATIPDHPWAGEYIRGSSNFTAHLWVAPKSGVVYQFRSCFGFEGNIGTLVDSDSELSISWRWNDVSYPQGMDVYIPVRWGREVFLVAQQNLLDFGNDARSDSPYFESKPFRRKDPNEHESDSKPLGKMVYPKGYEKYRDVESIEAVVIHVSPPTIKIIDEKRHFELAFMINAGKEQGVFPKSELSFLEGNKKTPSGVVKVADATTATLIVTTILDKDEEDPSIHLGERVVSQRSLPRNKR